MRSDKIRLAKAITVRATVLLAEKKEKKKMAILTSFSWAVKAGGWDFAKGKVQFRGRSYQRPRKGNCALHVLGWP